MPFHLTSLYSGLFFTPKTNSIHHQRTQFKLAPSSRSTLALHSFLKNSKYLFCLYHVLFKSNSINLDCLKITFSWTSNTTALVFKTWGTHMCRDDQLMKLDLQPHWWNPSQPELETGHFLAKAQARFLLHWYQRFCGQASDIQWLRTQPQAQFRCVLCHTVWHNQYKIVWKYQVKSKEKNCSGIRILFKDLVFNNGVFVFLFFFNQALWVAKICWNLISSKFDKGYW